MKKLQPTLFGLTALVICLISCGVPASKLASTCAELYPCKDSLTIHETTRTDTVQLLDTYVEYLDTTNCPPSANGVNVIDIDTVRVPGHKVIITRTVKDSTWYRLDQAIITSLTQERDAAIAERDAAKAKNVVKAVKGLKIPWPLYLLLIPIGFLLYSQWQKTKDRIERS